MAPRRQERNEDMSSLTCFVNIDTLTSTPHDFHLVANREEQLEIAKRLNLLFVKGVDAQLHLEKNGLIALTGRIKANIAQECVRTLVPVTQYLDINVNEFFYLASEEDKKELDLDELETAEPLEGHVLDLGEVVIQLISLNLNPYPVAPESEPIEYHDENNSSSPFDVLKKKE